MDVGDGGWISLSSHQHNFVANITVGNATVLVSVIKARKAV